MTINQILKISTEKLKSQNIPSADLDAEVLLLEALNRDGVHSLERNKSCYNQIKNAYRLKPELHRNRSWLYINNDYELSKSEEKLFNGFIKQRLKHKPVAYIVNKKEFYGYEFYVDENVLIPRPETEFMVEEVLRILTGVHTLVCNNSGLNKINSYRLKPELQNFKYLMDKNFNLIDIGTGSGCVMISVLNEIEKDKTNRMDKAYKTNIYSAYANDISPEAIEIAKYNAKKYNLDKKIKFSAGDFEKFIKEKLFLASDQFIITANLPYIKNDEYKNLPPNVRKYEPKIALAGGEDGLGLIEKLINLISNIKVENNLFNYLLLEADPSQMKKIKSILKKKLNAIDIKIIKDLSGKNRLISAKIQRLS